MREDVAKFLFVGLQEDKAAFFERAQVEGLIHFIDPHMMARNEVPEAVQRLTSAIKVLRGLPFREQEEHYNGLQGDKVVNEILRLHEQNDKLLEEQRVLEVEISRIDVFGNFSLTDIQEIEKKGKKIIQFFCARPGLFDEEPAPENLIYISSEYGLDYYVAINDEPVSYEKMIEMKFDRSLGQLKERQSVVLHEQHQIEKQLKGYAKYNEFLHKTLVEKLNQAHLANAQEYIQETMDGSLFAVEGWIPKNKVQQIKNIVEDLHVYSDEIAIEPTDVVPTYLENQGFGRLGEDLVRIYDTPSATDKDPSKWVLFCFALFFAFIIGDAGYGLIYLGLALFLRYKYPNVKGTAKRVLDLFTLLCVGCVIWGTLMTSFFGMQIGIDNPLRKLSLVQWLAENKAAYHLRHNDGTVQDWVKKYPELSDVKDPHTFVSFNPDPKKGLLILNKLTDNVMFELALFIGVVHLTLSLLRYVRRNWHNIGWIAFLIGAYLYFPYYLKTPSLLNYVGGIDIVEAGKFGFDLMLAGIGVAWVLSIIRNGWTGIFEITVLIQVFADTLSYLRLYALGLAGAIVGSTINDIASGMPLLIGVLLIIISHFINIVLGTMSGIIHGLRLNFLEWYHYSFEGGGRQFQPLKLLKRD